MSRIYESLSLKRVQDDLNRVSAAARIWLSTIFEFLNDFVGKGTVVLSNLDH